MKKYIAIFLSLVMCFLGIQPEIVCGAANVITSEDEDGKTIYTISFDDKQYLFGNLEITDARLVLEESMITFYALYANIGLEATELETIRMYFYDARGNMIDFCLNGVIGSTKEGQYYQQLGSNYYYLSIQAGTTLGYYQWPDLLNAVSYKIVADNGEVSSDLLMKENIDFSYLILNEEEKTCEIVGYSGTEEYVNIPKEINGYTVVKIGSRAFANKTNLKGDIIIPDTVESIGAYAFHKCSGFSGKIRIPGSVKEIREGAFSELGGIQEGELVIEEGLEYIGKSAFANTKLSNNIELPDSIIEIGESAFLNNNFTGILFLPQSLKQIRKDAFATADFSKIYMPSSVSYIEEGVFEGSKDGVIIYVEKNSYGKQWAEKNGFNYQIEEEKTWEDIANAPHIYSSMLDNILTERSWVIETIVENKLTNNPYAVYKKIQGDKLASMDAANIMKNPVFSALVNTYDFAVNLNTEIEDVFVGEQTEALSELIFVFNDNAQMVFDDIYTTRQEAKIQGALQNIVNVQYTSEELGCSFSSEDNNKSMIEECLSIIKKAEPYAEAGKDLIDNFATGTETVLKSKMLSYTNEYVPLLADSAIKYLDEYIKSYKTSTSSKMKAYKQQCLYEKLNGIQYLKSIKFDDDAIMRSWKRELDLNFYASNVSKLLDKAEKPIELITGALNVYVEYEKILSNAQKISEQFEHLAEFTTDSKLKNEIKRFSKKVEMAGEEQVCSIYDGIVLAYENDIFSGATDYLEEKIKNKFLQIWESTASVSNKYTATNVLAKYNAVLFGITMGSFIADKSLNTEAVVNSLLEIQLDQKLIKIMEELFYEDLKQYQDNPTEQQAEIVLEDLNLIKKTKMQQINLLYDTYEKLMQAPANSALRLVKDKVELEIETLENLKSFCDNHRNVLIASPIYSTGYYGNNVLELKENERFVANVGYDSCAKISTGVKCQESSILYFEDVGDVYIPFVEVNGNVTIIARDGTVTIGQLLLNSGSLKIGGEGTVVVDNDVTFPSCGFTLEVEEKSNLEILGTLDVSLRDVKYKCYLNVHEGGTLYVQEDLLAYETIYYSSHFMPVIYANGKIEVNGNADMDGYKFYMQNDNAYVFVKGDFTLDMGRTLGTYFNNESCITHGILEVQGNFLTDSVSDVALKGNQTTILSGHKKQNVRGIFGNLKITNDSEEGVEFTCITDAWLMGGKQHQSRIWGTVYVSPESKISGSTLESMLRNRVVSIEVTRYPVKYNTEFDIELQTKNMELLVTYENGVQQITHGGWNMTYDLNVSDEIEIEFAGVKTTILLDKRMQEISDFIERLYHLVLERKADSDEMKLWKEALSNKESNGTDIAYGFVFSEECLDRKLSNEYFIEMLYNTFMNRSADEAGKEAWISQLEAGVEREKILEGFIYSQEFTEICREYGIDVGKTDSVEAFAEALGHYCNQNADLTKFVARCYTEALGREYDPVGLEDWCRVIIEQENSPKQVAQNFIFSDEFVDKKLSNEEYVNVLYHTFMGREADEEGLAEWISVLESGEEDRAKVLEGFSDSLEFAEILEGFGLN